MRGKASLPPSSQLTELPASYSGGGGGKERRRRCGWVGVGEPPKSPREDDAGGTN